MPRSLAATLALLLSSPAAAPAQPAPAQPAPAQPAPAQPAPAQPAPAIKEPLPAPIVLRAPRRARFGIGGLMVSPQRDLEEQGTVLLDLEASPGVRLIFGYPADSELSFLLGFRYFWLRSSDGALASNSSLGYYDFGLGMRYTLPVGEMTDFIGEALVIGSSVKLRDDSGGGFPSQAKSGVGALARAGAVIMLTPGRALVLSGSYSITRLSNFFDGSQEFYPTFFSVEVGIEWKL